MTTLRSVSTVCLAVSAPILLVAASMVVPNDTRKVSTDADEQANQQNVRNDNSTQTSPSPLPVNSQQSEKSFTNVPETAEKEGNDRNTANSSIEHGKYLVHHVAQCIQCHTPRDESGALIRSRLLTGAPIPVAGPRFAQPWAAESAWIAGLGSYDDAFVHYLLTHGQKPDGSSPKRPMPSFEMTDADAEAVIAYLRSL